MRRGWWAVIGALLLAVGTSPATAGTKVTTALGGDGLLFVMHHLALGGGFFTGEGLDVEAVDVGSGPRQAAALMGGSSEFTSLGFIHVLNKLTVPVVGIPLGYYLAAQGSLIVLLALLYLLAKKQPQS